MAMICFMKIKSFLFVITVASLLCCNVMAGDVENKTKELSGLQVKIRQISQAVNDLKTHKHSLLADLERLEVGYGKSIRFLAQLEKQIAALKKALEINQQQQRSKREQIKSQKQGLENQVKAAYALGKKEKLKLMLNQQDPAMSGRMMVYYDFLNKTRLKKIAAIKQDLLALQELENQRNKEAAELDKKIEEKKQRQIALQKEKAEREQLLVEINSQFRSKSKQLNQFKQDEKKLASLILTLQQVRDDFPFNEGVVKEFSKLKGSLPWPVKGSLVKRFGDQRSESRWDGVLIKAREGREVRAVTRGQVVYADWLRGYGLLTIIKHDNGYMTLYAFNQSLYKSKGDWVEAGSVIATVGLTGGRLSAGLYFGIRKKGKPVDPVKWCRKSRHGDVG